MPRCCKFNPAINFLKRGLIIARRIKDVGNQVAALSTIGNCYIRLKQIQCAIRYFDASLNLARKSGDVENEKEVLTSLGSAYCALGNVIQGIDYFYQSYALSQEIGAEDSVGYALYNLAVSYTQIQHWQQALLCALKSLAIFDRLQLPDAHNTINLIWKLIRSTELDVQDIESALSQIADLYGDSVAKQMANRLSET